MIDCEIPYILIIAKCLNNFYIVCIIRFIHESPEDSEQVPGGFLSDVNTVSFDILLYKNR